MRILVTGATGFVGPHLLRELHAAWPEAQLFGIARREPDESLPSDATFLRADLMDAEQLLGAVRESAPDQVYHLGGEASAAAGDRDALFRANVLGTELLWEALADQSRPTAMLVASSGYVYGPCDEQHPATEEDTPAPLGDYAESKARMEARLRAEIDGPVRIVIARSFNHAGPGQSVRFAIPAFARQLVEGDERPTTNDQRWSDPARRRDGETATDERRPIVLKVGNLEARRDYTDVRDVVRAYRLMLAVGEAGECFNVCSGVAVSLVEVLRRMQTLAGVDVIIERDPARDRPVDLPVSVGSPAKLEARTGWRRAYDLTTTLADVLDECRAGR